MRHRACGSCMYIRFQAATCSHRHIRVVRVLRRGCMAFYCMGTEGTLWTHPGQNRGTRFFSQRRSAGNMHACLHFSIEHGGCRGARSSVFNSGRVVIDDNSQYAIIAHPYAIYLWESPWVRLNGFPTRQDKAGSTLVRPYTHLPERSL